MEVQLERPKTKQKKRKEKKAPATVVQESGPSAPIEGTAEGIDIAQELSCAASEEQLQSAQVIECVVEEEDKVISYPKLETAPQAEDVVQPETYRIDLDSINQFVEEVEKQSLVSAPPEQDVIFQPIQKIPEIQCVAPQILQLELEIEIVPFNDKQLHELYQNSESIALKQFNLDFLESELKGISVKQHPLYELLATYLQERREVVKDTLQLEQTRKECGEAQEDLWTLSSSVVSGRGECSDGNVVTATHTFTKASFHRSTFQSVSRTLSNIRHIANESLTLHAYATEISKLNIDFYIQNVTNNCLGSANISRNSPVVLSLDTPQKDLLPQLYDLRTCISILFSFQRKLIKDSTFIEESRKWLIQLVAILLRVATWQDHLFILNHILRCPPRIGAWASKFIQLPLCLDRLPFANYQINHIVATLSLILLPIDKREQFLLEFCQQTNSETEALWVVVDSEGEEDEETSGTFLRENDIVGFLNQLPFANLFKSVLLLEQREDNDVYSEATTSHEILRLFSFSTFLLKILERGLTTYNHSRYTQLCKRICRLVKHTVEYATDQYELFLNFNKVLDNATSRRLQLEYDSFFAKAAKCLYSAKKSGAWQFLAVIPYHMISLRTLWHLLYLLHDSYTSEIDFKISIEDIKSKLEQDMVKLSFQETLNSLEDGECYYLLNTFANMALARELYDMGFIKLVLIDLLQIGFISETTQEACSKNARILLTHLTSKHPVLLSDIVAIVHRNMASIGQLSLYLYEELPLSIWRPTSLDLDVISRWLTHSAANSTESKLCRMIISRLNWNLLDTYYLFLPYSVHCQVALLALQAANQEPALYTNWAWQTVLRLKLHINDKGFKDFADVKQFEDFDTLVKGVREQQPLASFISLLMSSYGHLVPIICKKGLDQLTNLQLHQKHEAVLFALNLIVPLFIECQEVLINNEKYQTVLHQLLTADRGYINYAKSFIVTQTTVLEQFGNLIENQISNCTWYNLSTPKYIARIWVNSLVSLPNWNRDFGVMYLLDIIIKASFFYSDAMEAIKLILKDLLQCVTPQEQSNSISSLFKWVSTVGNSGNLLINTSLSGCPWLAYVMLQLEFEERERSTGLWRELLTQLQLQKGKVNVDAAIKKAANICKAPSFLSGSLCLYRWAQQALDCPLDHPLLPLLWQKFFELYLYRLDNSSEKGCIGEKFFEGLVNSTFQRRLKKRLQEAVDLFKTKVADLHDADTDQRHLYSICAKILTSFNLWLDEPRLHEPSLHLLSLPPQYEPRLLSLIFTGSTSPWLEYMDYARIKDDQTAAVKTWRCANYRENTNVNKPLAHTQKNDDPLIRIVDRLKSYDNPISAPFIIDFAPNLKPINTTDKAEVNAALNAQFKTVFQFAHNYNLRVAEQTALDCTYQELLPQLYRSVPIVSRKAVNCSGTSKSIHCTGAATVILQSEEARINDHIDHQIKANRTEYESLLSKSMQTPAKSLCLASVFIQQVINTLQCQVKENPAVIEIGVELFYYILSKIPEDSSHFLPTKKLLATCLEKLGQSHISGFENQMPRLLNKILQEPNLGMYLAPHFDPSDVGIANFLLMYSTVSKDMSDKYDIAFALLSKFDVGKWLLHRQPKLPQRTQCIQLVVAALLHLGLEPSVEAHALHGLYRCHLVCLLRHHFPEHYGEILMLLLRGSNQASDTGCLATIVWTDVLLSVLAEPARMEVGIYRDQLRQYAHKQQTLHYQELLQTAQLLGQHFTHERQQYGLYGLYPKTRSYVEVFSLFLGMTGHALILSTINTHQGMLGDKLCEIIWPQLKEIFGPWLIPYWLQNMKENMATWIQQLTDDRSVLLPWIPGDAPFAQKVAQMFFECVLFLIQTLPACQGVLSCFWQWYVTNFANPLVKEHVLHVVHTVFINLPWYNFWPSLVDLEFMVKVVDQYLPDCHKFLGVIFVDISWHSWLYGISDNMPIQLKTRIYNCLLVLIIKLSNEPNIKSNCSEKARNLLVYAENYDWSLIESENFQQIMDWFVTSYDPMVLYKTDPLNLDFRVLNFLRVVSGYDKPLPIPHPTQNELAKRHIYVRGYVKLVGVFATRHKSLIPTKEAVLVNVMENNLSHMEKVIVDQQELNTILGEYLSVLNQSVISSFLTKFMEDWFKTNCGDARILTALLQVLATKVVDCNSVATLLESGITSYFENNETRSWNYIQGLINFYHPNQSELIKTFIAKDCVLSLYALYLQKIDKQDCRNILNMAIDWLVVIKPSESIETKLPLIWYAIAKTSLNFCSEDEANAGIILYKLAQNLQQYSEEKEPSKWGRGLLNVIGITTNSGFSLQFRFLSRSLAGYILAQLPDMKGQPLTVRCKGGAANPVGQPGGNTECAKVLLKLDFGQSQGKIKECAELALKQIQNPSNSLHNVGYFLSLMLSHFYTQPYLNDIR